MHLSSLCHGLCISAYKGHFCKTSRFIWAFQHHTHQNALSRDNSAFKSCLNCTTVLMVLCGNLVMYICNGADLSWYPLPTICQTMLGKQTSKLQKNNWNKFLYWNKFQKSVKILLHFLHVTHFYSLLTRYYSATVAYNNRRIRKLVMIFILWIPKCSYPCRKSNLQVPQR